MRAFLTALTFAVGFATVTQLSAPLVGGAAWLLWSAALATLVARDQAFALFAAGLAAVVVHVIGEPYWALGLFAAFIYTPRAFAARTTLAAISLLIVAFSVGALCVWTVQRFPHAPLHIAWLVAGLCFIIPMLIPVDDHIAYRLRSIADRSEGRLRWVVLRAAAIRRVNDHHAPELPEKTRVALTSSWNNVVDLCEQTTRVRGKTRDLLEERLSEHLRTISSTYASATSVDAMSDSITDETLHDIIAESERFEAELAALHEVAG